LQDDPSHAPPRSSPGADIEGAPVEPQAAGGIDALALTIALSLCLLLALVLLLATSC
jgi:hypothetical protein